ncbi:glycosyl hydrolase [Plectosphaerella plurivora]|uniref:Glycosyl hydrolase n=1 Tax=Plectosphaerella plurivora TaxID=936078 RepID=A0A9P8V600_9PEZI|nr:glycosyl hydrolase [Plectosphaerella plurivora]
MSLATDPSPAPTRHQHRFHPRPVFHLKAPQGWMNDPCAPAFDVATGTYHMFYQWNPESCDWGNITWGHATSTDGLLWNHTAANPALRPSEPYDKEGIFTGCFWPTGPHGEPNQLTVVYSSITALPIHWTLEHTRNSEGVSLATSTDNGRTWEKSPLNPIITGEPEDLRVTGFRDPFLASWPALDRARGEKSLYGILSGGIVDQTPTVFIYAVAPDDLTTWRYLGPLVDIGRGFRTPGPWNGDFGVNWECVNFMTLRNGIEEKEFLLMGTEGGIKPGPDPAEPLGQWALFFAGNLEQTPEGPRLRHDFDGIVDHGCLYAVSSYEHPVSRKRILFGWIKEDELPAHRRAARGWAGYLSLPRELSLYSMRGVIRGLRSPLADIGSLKATPDASGSTNTIQTLGIRPLDDLRQLRPARPARWTSLGSSGLSGILKRARSTSWELEATVAIHPEDHDRVGFHICHNHDASQRTTVYFETREERLIVDKSTSNADEEIAKPAESGPFTLFYLADGSGGETLENLKLRIFRDGDTLEVFANDRFALSTTVYADEACAGLSWFVEGSGDVTGVFESVELWDELGRESDAVNPHL